MKAEAVDCVGPTQWASEMVWDHAALQGSTQPDMRSVLESGLERLLAQQEQAEQHQQQQRQQQQQLLLQALGQNPQTLGHLVSNLGGGGVAPGLLSKLGLTRPQDVGPTHAELEAALHGAGHGAGAPDDAMLRVLLSQANLKSSQLAPFLGNAVGLGGDSLGGSTFGEESLLMPQAGLNLSSGLGSFATADRHRQLAKHLSSSTLPHWAGDQSHNEWNSLGTLQQGQAGPPPMSSTWPAAMLSGGADLAKLPSADEAALLEDPLLQVRMLQQSLGNADAAVHNPMDSGLQVSASAAAASLRLAQSIQAMQALVGRKGPSVGGASSHQNPGTMRQSSDFGGNKPGLDPSGQPADQWGNLESVIGALAQQNARRGINLGAQTAVGEQVPSRERGFGARSAEKRRVGGSRSLDSNSADAAQGSDSAHKKAQWEEGELGSPEQPSCKQRRVNFNSTASTSASMGQQQEEKLPGASSASRRSEPQTEEEKRLRKLALNREAARRMRKRQATRLEQLEKTVLELQAANLSTRNRLREAEKKVVDLEKKNEGLEERVVTVVGTVMGKDGPDEGLKEKLAALVSCLSSSAFASLPEAVQSLCKPPSGNEEDGRDSMTAKTDGEDIDSHGDRSMEQDSRMLHRDTSPDAEEFTNLLEDGGYE